MGSVPESSSMSTQYRKAFIQLSWVCLSRTRSGRFKLARAATTYRFRTKCESQCCFPMHHDARERGQGTPWPSGPTDQRAQLHQWMRASV